MRKLINGLQARLGFHLLQQRLLLIIHDKSVTMLPWNRGRLGDAVVFPNSLQGLEEGGRYLAMHDATLPVYVLADVQEEELHREVLPRLIGLDRRNMIQRRLERLFRATPYCLAEFQGQSKPGFERVLFCGLTQPGRIQPWIQLLQRHHRVVAGLWSVPLLSRALLHRITELRPDHVILIHFNAEGQRQTIFHEGRTILGRMIPGPCGQAESVAASVVNEVGKTRMYLASLRLVPRETTLHVFVLCADSMTDTFLRILTNTIDSKVVYHVTGTGEAGRKLGLHSWRNEENTQLFFGHLLMTERSGIACYPLPDVASSRWSWLSGWFAPRTPRPVDSQASMTPPTRRLGDLLVEKGVISEDQLSIALTEQSRSQKPLGKVLITLGFLTEQRMRDLLGGILEQESIDLSHQNIDPEVAKLVSKEFAKRHGVVPISWNSEQNHLVVAMANTLDMVTLDRLLATLPPGTTIDSKLATETEINETLDRMYGYELSVDGILHEMESGEVDLESLSAHVGEFSHPMIRLVNALLVDAIKHDASDLHLSPMNGFIQIRYRVDGVLRAVRSLHQKFQAGLTVRVKVVSGMDIAETRFPQDGHFSLAMAGRIVDFRVSSQPTIHGENLVVRILDRKRRIMSLEALGLSSYNQTCINHMMSTPEGIILVTGPTGSGKTTTLYSIIASLNAIERNIMTQEDPVEYPMPFILQTSVNESIKLDFATGIRSILRQDPDIILVGEIRDMETAQMALRAAMTGHQVYSTLHTNSALAAIPRLLNMGLESHTLAGNIIGVLAQRLVRRLCLQCRRPQPLDAVLRRELRLPEDMGGETVEIYQAVGCAACGETGFKGRLCLMEALIVDDDFHDLIARSALPVEFRRTAREKGFQTLWEDGVRHVLQGDTSSEEILRVLGRAVIH